MANQVEVARLRRGVEMWNQWRKQHPEVRPDLSFAKLSGANPYDLDLYGADLRGALLNRADLSHTNLSGADLHDANLHDALVNGRR